MAYQQPPQGYPQQPMAPQQPQMQQPGYPAPPPMPMPMAQPMTPAEGTWKLLLLAILLGGVGLLVRYLCGFFDPGPGIRKLGNLGNMIFSFGLLSLAFSLLWSAFKVFEQAVVRVFALIVGFSAFVTAFFLFQ